MYRNDTFETHDRIVGLGLIGLIVLGLLAGMTVDNWALLETWLPLTLFVLLLILFYRLVVAVEHLAYDG